MLLVSIGLDCKINFYDVILNKNIKTFEADQPLLCLSFFVDGKTIAVGGRQGLVTIYDLSQGKEANAIFNGHTENVTCVDFTHTSPSNQQNSAPKKKDNNINQQNSNHTQKQSPPQQLGKIKESINEYDYTGKSLKDSTTENKKEEIIQQPKQEIENKRIIDYSEYAKDKLNPVKENSQTKEDAVQGDSNMIVNKVNANTNLIKTAIENTVKEEFRNLKEFIHEELKHFHLDMIRQFQLQEIQIINEIRNSIAANQALNKELKDVRKENAELKTN
eukprot:CAMPEP_0170517508 /NCGR_PEP_ID=MMETSP0209-20121228/3481_1 /TAXON_ID=665100 ORGANISM="Litonotus pictus, Strain P1" /NCGR_SAMPLE_ID=MMETSP0209 /ASSEMBLY_ACC=CAM_ASM_000301 /LENGTH=274 /DNA_ID=CAMNT_0010802779 /DNA_START=731 /DNA_END=1552 /DNA_ORIENTATION=+